MRVAKRIFFITINALFLAAIALLTLRFAAIGSALEAQKAAQRWKGESEERFAQVSAFFPAGKGLGEEQIRSIATAVDSKLTESSLEAPEGGSLWTYAYSAWDSLTVTSKYESSSVSAVGVGGDFFLFHNLRLLSGSYISGSDIMKDRVVLDETLAWKLFGSSDVEGMEITLAGRSLLVAGVVEAEDDSFSRRVYGETPVIYMSYELLSGVSNAEISCYEAVLPNPISGFGLDIVKAALPDSEAADVLENSGRYSPARLRELIEDFGSRSIQDRAISYPYWENAARVAEDNMALLMAVTALLALVPLAGLLILAALLIRLMRRNRRRFYKAVGGIFERRIEKRRRLRYNSMLAARESAKKARSMEKKAPVRSLPSAPPENGYQDEDSDIGQEAKMDIEALVREILEEDWD